MKSSWEQTLAEAKEITSEAADRLRGMSLRPLQWAAARLLFLAYIGISLATGGLFGFATYPLMTRYFYGDWRMWRYYPSANGLWLHGYRMLFHILNGQNGGFMLSVSLTSPPTDSVDLSRTRLHPGWEFGSSCGPCSRCCQKIHCPILNQETGLCRGYQSFFWRYFNCGRFPIQQAELNYYACPKWVMSSKESTRAQQSKTDSSSTSNVA